MMFCCCRKERSSVDLGWMPLMFNCRTCKGGEGERGKEVGVGRVVG